MPSEERPTRDRSVAEEREIARRRNELLAEARGIGGGGRERKGGAGSASRLMGLGFQFLLAILLGLYGGQWLDRRLGSAPWFLIIGVFLGAGAIFYAMYRAMAAEGRRLDEERRK